MTSIFIHKSSKRKLVNTENKYIWKYTQKKDKKSKYWIFSPLLYNKKANYNNTSTTDSYSLTGKKSIFINHCLKQKMNVKDVFNDKYINILKKSNIALYLHYKNSILTDKYIHKILSKAHGESLIKTIIFSSPLIRSSNFYKTINNVWTYYLKNKKKMKSIIDKGENTSNLFNYELLGDITSSLSTIESILEPKISFKINVSQSVGFISNVQWIYDYSLGNNKLDISLYNIDKKAIYIESLVANTNICLYETKSSIITNSNILIPNKYSVNNILLNIYLEKTKYFTQHISSKVSHVFIFNSILESLLKCYSKHNILIPSIYFELIVKKMTSFVRITYPADSIFVASDIISFSKVTTLNEILTFFNYKNVLYYPIVLGITRSAIIHPSVLASLSFKDVFNRLTYLSIDNAVDWLTDLKSNIINSTIIKSGSGWYRHFIKI